MFSYGFRKLMRNPERHKRRRSRTPSSRHRVERLKERTFLTRVAPALSVILALCCLAYLVSNLVRERERTVREPSPRADLLPEEFRAGREPGAQHQPLPVALNRGPEVLDGFRGDVHPLLHGRTRLEVTAHWTPVGKGQAVYSRKGDHYPF